MLDLYGFFALLMLCGYLITWLLLKYYDITEAGDE